MLKVAPSARQCLEKSGVWDDTSPVGSDQRFLLYSGKPGTHSVSACATLRRWQSEIVDLDTGCAGLVTAGSGGYGR